MKFFEDKKGSNLDLKLDKITPHKLPKRNPVLRPYSGGQHKYCTFVGNLGLVLVERSVKGVIVQEIVFVQRVSVLKFYLV